VTACPSIASPCNAHSVYRFARRPRWVVLHVIVVVTVPLFALAGVWQLHRLDERRTHNALVRSREGLPARPLRAVIADGDAEHRRVRVTGRYDTSEEVVLVGRSNAGIEGSHVLTPLVIDAKDAVLVDRGWVPPGMEDPPLQRARPPDGDVTITGFLLPTEARGAPHDATQTQLVDHIDVASLAKSSRHGFTTTELYVLLQSQQPAPSDLPTIVKPAGLSEGPHLGYAIQWFLFIPTLLAVYVTLLRQQAKRAAAAERTAAP
jgi:surfeit locus 1 family protein